MKLTVERLPGSRALLDIAADDAEFANAMDVAARRVAQQVALPGFRKGKAPRAMIEKAYGRGIFLEEAHRVLMDDLYRAALEQANLSPVGRPEVEVTEIEPLAFRVTVPVYPEIEVGSYGDVRVEPIDAGVDDETLAEAIERLRKGASPWVDPEEEGMELGADNVLQPKLRSPREGDQVTIDYSVWDETPDQAEEEQDAQFVLGESGLLERLEEEITKLKVGETVQFDASFEADDEVVDPGLRGKTMHYTVTLKGLKQRDLLALDDDFAKTVSDLDTLEELRERMRQNLHQEKTSNARAEVLTKVIEQMAEGASFEIPAAMIDDAVEEDINAMRQRLAQRGLAMDAYLRLTGQSIEDIRRDGREAAERRLRQSLLLREIAQREDIQVLDHEIVDSVARMVGSASGTSNPAQAEAFFRSDYVRNTLRNELFDRKLQDRLIDLATEGRGAVLNAWVAPVAAEGVSDAAVQAVVAAALADGEPADSSDDSSDDETGISAAE